VYAIAKKLLPPLHVPEKKFQGDLSAFKGTYQMPKYVGDNNTISVEPSSAALLMKRSWMQLKIRLPI
jgi:hypothetical protein